MTTPSSTPGARPTRARRLPWSPGLYAIVDPEHCGGREPLEVADAILAGGCSVLQLRDKRGDDRATRALALALASRCRAGGVPFVVNDFVELAVQVGADGLHLGQDDVAVPDARARVGDMPIGLSTHDLTQARRAVEAGADLIGFGPVYGTTTKRNPDPTVGVEQLATVARAVALPVVAIGGVTLARAPEAIAAGATWVATIGATCAAPDPRSAAGAIHRAVLGAMGPAGERS